MITLNTNYTLSWDWDPIAARNHNVAFTTQYLARYKYKYKKRDWSVVHGCEKSSHTHCDLTQLKLHYLGIYMVRVQANVDGRESDWVEKEFCPDKDATIGPPTNMNVSAAGSHLDVYILDPLSSSNSSMREHLPNMYYCIIYWEHSTDRQGFGVHMLNTSANLVTLSNLKPWTPYCVSVQTRSDFYNKSSTFTLPHCVQTEGTTPWWQIFLYFLLSLVMCFLLVLLPLYALFRCLRTLKSIFYPSIQLPTHFQEYLCDSSPGSDIPRLLAPESEEALVCDEVSVFPQAVFLEIHNPPPAEELQPDSSGRHSHQDSGGSRDSGVYSTEGGSSLWQPNSSTSTGTEDSSQDPKDLEEVKMQDMDPEIKSRRLITDEGVSNVCV
ncbi:hypothetical protein LDENG_00033690 [Lucifuga dentata]|nr:hypothetical protein LDENG_00033690 [Lucifuga dentata]